MANAHPLPSCSPWHQTHSFRPMAYACPHQYLVPSPSALTGPVDSCPQSASSWDPRPALSHRLHFQAWGALTPSALMRILAHNVCTPSNLTRPTNSEQWSMRTQSPCMMFSLGLCLQVWCVFPVPSQGTCFNSALRGCCNDDSLEHERGKELERSERWI